MVGFTVGDAPPRPEPPPLLLCGPRPPAGLRFCWRLRPGTFFLGGRFACDPTTRGELGDGTAAGAGEVVCCLVMMVVVVIVVMVVPPAPPAGASLTSAVLFGGVSVRVTVVTVVSSFRVPGDRSSGDPLRTRSRLGEFMVGGGEAGEGAGFSGSPLAGEESALRPLFLPLFRVLASLGSVPSARLRCFLEDLRFSALRPVGESSGSEAARDPEGSSY